MADIPGTPGNDVLHGTEEPDRIEGFGGNDQLYGHGADDVLIGGDDNDLLAGQAGADRTDGGLGNDVHYVDNPDDVVIERPNEGDDTVRTTVSYTLPAEAEVEALGTPGASNLLPLNLTGNRFAQSIYGNAADNVLNSAQGDDNVVGLGGNDTLISGGGDDILQGGTGNDIYVIDIAYGDSVTWIRNGQESHRVWISDNDGALPEDQRRDYPWVSILDPRDTSATPFYVDAGDLIAHDRIIELGGAGDDIVRTSLSYRLSAGAEVETLGTTGYGNTAAIRLWGNEFGQSIYGNAVDNGLYGEGGNDHLVGLEGDDILDGGTGNDNLRGGRDNDIYYVDAARDAVFENFGEGDDIVASSVSYDLRAGAEVEAMRTTIPTGTAAINLAGNEFGQSIYGNAGDNRLFGFGGNDLLVGGAGRDLLDGGTGQDNLRGGTGNDSYRVDSGIDRVFENAGEGDDAIVAYAPYSLDAGVEVETLAAAEGVGPRYIDLTGNEFAQTIFGNAGANILRGGGGADSLHGYDGADRLVGGAGGDNLRGGADSFTDHFVYQFASDSTAAARDSILDFTAGDLIDLQAIDTDPSATYDQAFTFIGDSQFGGNAGELRAWQDVSGRWFVEGDVDGDAAADLVIAVTTADANPITAADFVL